MLSFFNYFRFLSVTGSSGIKSVINRTVIVNDTTSPIITLLGPASLTIQAGATYQDAGATAIV
jgi:hypothetical protein